MHHTIVALQEALDSIKALRDQKVDIYLRTAKDILHISEHAKVRYLERIEHLKLHGYLDKDRLASAQTNIDGLEDRMLSREDKEKIVRDGIKIYQKGKARFVIVNLTVVTVTKT